MAQVLDLSMTSTTPIEPQYITEHERTLAAQPHQHEYEFSTEDQAYGQQQSRYD
jgi:hypothetical protein